MVDGYNVIGIQHRNIEAERERLVEALAAYRRRTGHSITVVFDAWRGGSERPTRTSSGGVSVVYSSLGETADTRIRKIISRDDVQWIVVSSDREVQAYAWREGSVPVGSEDFLRKLEGGPQAGEFVPLEEDYGPPRRKGSPRRLSKKEKAVDRALKKL
ncbi:MAG: NYN domain-containing protein [Nitrospirota bacterium]